MHTSAYMTQRSAKLKGSRVPGEHSSSRRVPERFYAFSMFFVPMFDFNVCRDWNWTRYNPGDALISSAIASRARTDLPDEKRSWNLNGSNRSLYARHSAEQSADEPNQAGPASTESPTSANVLPVQRFGNPNNTLNHR